MRLGLELVFFIITVGVLPVVVNKSTEAHLDWVRRWLRELWFGIFVFFFAYWLITKPEIAEGAVSLHKHLPGWIGYGVTAVIGAVICGGFWWFTGKVAPVNPVATEAGSTAASSQTTTNSSAQHLTRTITENLTTEETSNPLGHLAQLGWGIKDAADVTEFSVTNKALPDMEESAKYFLALKKPCRLQFQQVPSIAGLHLIAGSHCYRIDIGASDIDSLSELKGMANLRELAVGQTPFTNLVDFNIDAVSSLTNLDTLVLSMSRARDIRPISHLTKLKSLMIMGTLVDDLSPATKLYSLKSVDVRESAVTDLSPLQGLAHLEELTIDAKQASSLGRVSQIKKLTIIAQVPVDMNQVGSLSNLETLSIWGPPAIDFSPLRKLDRLTSLHAMGTMLGSLSVVNDVGAIRELKLKTLALSGVQINSLNFLSGNSTITDLTLNSMPVTNGSELGTMPSLQKLTLFDVPIVDISPLLLLPKLREVSLLRVPARADVISTLQKRGVKVKNN
jgi:hypothetical protein